MDITYTNRSESIFTKKNNLEKLIEWRDLFLSAAPKNLKKKIYLFRSWEICKDPGCIQLSKLLLIDLVYSSYHSEALGEVWKIHHKNFTKFISENTSKIFLRLEVQMVS